MAHKNHVKILPVIASFLLLGATFLASCNTSKDPVLSENWSFDEDHHWKVDLNTDERYYFSSHNLVDGVCTLCGYKKVDGEKEPDVSDIPLLPDGEQNTGEGDEDDPSSPPSLEDEDDSKGAEYIEGLSYTELKDEQGVIGWSVAAGDLVNEKEIEIPAAFRELPVLEIAESGFAQCLNLEKVTIPAVETVGYRAFERCAMLREINFAQGIKEISDWAFSDCRALEKVTIPEGIEIIRYKTFNNCTRLKEAVLPSTLNRVGNKAFYGCGVLEKVNLPSNLKEIGSYSFYQCYKLQNLTFPEGLEEIGHYCFFECESFTSAYLPDTVTWIGYEVFYGCSRLKEVKLSEKMTVVNWSDFYDCTSLERVVLSDNITTIENYAFANCRSLSYAELGKGITRMGSCVFYFCVSLDSVSYRGTREEWNAIHKGIWWDYTYNPKNGVCSVLFI